MSARLYVRPLARIGAQPRDGARVPVLGVGQRGDLLFAAAELIERDGGRITRSVRSSDRLQAPPAALPGLLDRFRQPRPPIAGVALDRTRIMGIVNVTPDSFSDGGGGSIRGRPSRTACSWRQRVRTSSTSAGSPRGPGRSPSASTRN
jgi:dihydropteroate synthase